jgi:glycosyltransferase involved in cell wall biosynthesis
MGTAGALRTEPPAGRHALPHQSRVVALVPAHDEEAQIGATLAALARQSRRPDLVVVVCDDCTDHTASIARAAGATVLTTEATRTRRRARSTRR